MAKVTLQPGLKGSELIKGMRGKVGNLVFRQSPNGDIIVSKAPDMSAVEWSPAQQEQRRRFKAAIAYAKDAMADSHVRTVYEKLGQETGRQPFRVAVSDYFKGVDLLSEK